MKIIPQIDPSKDTYSFETGGSVGIEFFPKGSFLQPGVPCIKSSVKLDFPKNRAVFFNATGIKNHSIKNIKEVRDEIIELYKKKSWNKNYVVITRLVQADSTTLIISGKSGASITLEAESELLPNINFKDASIKFNLLKKEGIEFAVISEEGLFPLIGISGIKPRGLLSYFRKSEPDFIPLTKGIYADIYSLRIYK